MRGPTTREFWRIVRTVPATIDDFRSYQELGIPLFESNNPELREAGSGVSVYSTEPQAHQAAKQAAFRNHAALAKLVIPLDASIRFQRTGQRTRGHHTLWAAADRLLEYVQEYVPLHRRRP